MLWRHSSVKINTLWRQWVEGGGFTRLPHSRKENRLQSWGSTWQLIYWKWGGLSGVFGSNLHKQWVWIQSRKILQVSGCGGCLASSRIFKHIFVCSYHQVSRKKRIDFCAEKQQRSIDCWLDAHQLHTPPWHGVGGAVLCDSSTSTVTYHFTVQSADGSSRILSLGGEESQRTQEDTGAFFVCMDTFKSPLLISEHLSSCLTAARSVVPFQVTYGGPVVLLMVILICTSGNKACFHKVCHCFCASLEHDLLWQHQLMENAGLGTRLLPFCCRVECGLSVLSVVRYCLSLWRDRCWFCGRRSQNWIWDRSVRCWRCWGAGWCCRLWIHRLALASAFKNVRICRSFGEDGEFGREQ